jgi:osmotically inducible protein OsmC
MIRKARAVWRGSGRSGNGGLSSDSGVLANTPYSFKTRFENCPVSRVLKAGITLDAKLV